MITLPYWEHFVFFIVFLIVYTSVDDIYAKLPILSQLVGLVIGVMFSAFFLILRIS